MGSAVSGFRVGAVAESALERYIDYVLANSPVAYWPMDDVSGLPQDLSGNGRHMTAVSGSPAYEQAGPFGAGSLDAAIEYPSAAHHERAVVSTAVANLTVEMWLRRNGNTSGDLFMHGTTSGGFQIEFTNTSGAYRPNLPGVGVLGTMGTIADTTWTHIALKREASQWTAYTDGSQTSTPGTASPGAPVGNTRIVGAAASGVRIAHLAFYDTALSGRDIAARYLIAAGLV